MPKIVTPLTDLQVKKLTEDGHYAVGGVQGLYLRIVSPNKYWVFRYTLNGKRRDCQFDKYPDVSLKTARERAVELKNLQKQGIDPIEWRNNKIQISQREQEQHLINSMTFRKMAEQYCSYQKHIGRYDQNPKEFNRLQGRLNKYLYPVIGDILFNEITHNHIAQVFLPIWLSHNSLCDKIRTIINQIFAWAKANNFYDKEIPTAPNVLKNLLPKRPPTKQKNHPMLPVKEIPEFFADLRTHPSISARCLEFAILTATRSGNAREAKWVEINFNTCQWIIPAEKMKVGANGDLIVPLSSQAMELLRELKEKSLGFSDYIFPSPVGGGALSDTSLKSVISKMHNEKIALTGKGYVDPKQLDKKGLPKMITAHGTARATFRTWSQDDNLGNDKRFTERTAELCLHHKVTDAYNGAYERNEAMKSRTEMMQAWGDYCYSEIKNA